ncbi:hypothetical protein [Microbacterium sp. 179-I 3D4 NHS]|uniref:hypothetical protein n=1 Tax=Microbacterium sp. 179-I 3D4 NHS TaxID=3142381 RepID=UPI00399F5CA3
MHPTRRPAVLRGFAASSVAVFAALAGHVTAGGPMPGPLGILVPWMLSFMLCVLLAGRRLSVIRLSLSVAVSQFLFHLLFVLGTITPSGAPAPHVHGAPLVLPASSPVPESVVADGTMWLGHLLAAVVTIAALHRGERLLLGLRDLAQQSVRWLQRRVAAVTVSPRPLSRTTRALVADAVELRSALLLSPLRGRAPPLSPAV